MFNMKQLYQKEQNIKGTTTADYAGDEISVILQSLVLEFWKGNLNLIRDDELVKVSLEGEALDAYAKVGERTGKNSDCHHLNYRHT